MAGTADVANTPDIEALFRLPLDEFTSARNALAARLKTAGRADAAGRVKALSRPPLSAWAVNQLYWRHRELFDRLLAAGGRLRRAQVAQLRGKGGDLREPLEARRAAMAELTRHAVALVREAGHSASPDLLRRITNTLDALATYAGEPSAPRAGRLTSDVEAPGFEALSTLIPRTGSRPPSRSSPHVLPFQRKPASKPRPADPAAEKRQREAELKAQRAGAVRAIRAAGRALASARAAAARAEAALRDAAARVKAAERNRETLAASMEKAVTEADRAREQARKVAATAENAAQAVADAERALDEARRQQRQLE